MSDMRLTPLTVLLLASLLLNGVFLGLVIGGQALRGPDRDAPRVTAPFALRAFIEAAPEPLRDELRAQARGELVSARRLMRQRRDAEARVWRILMAEEFDRAAAERALEDMRGARMAVDRKGQDVMLDMLERMDTETRRAALRAGFNQRRPPPERRDGGPAARPDATR